MKPEIEAKFLSVDPDDIRKRLKGVGAVCKQPMQLMRRIIFSTPQMDEKHSYVRVRDEGHRIAMTYKQFDEISLTGAKEVELTVNDFDTAVAFVEALGIKAKSVQEARREIWMLGDVEIVIDEWPWIKPYIEIEAPTEQQVKDVADKLGFEWSAAAFGDIMTAYRAEFPGMGTTYDDMIYNLPNIRFGDPQPGILKK
jgi:adenylate cyclase class 2